MGIRHRQYRRRANYYASRPAEEDMKQEIGGPIQEISTPLRQAIEHAVGLHNSHHPDRPLRAIEVKIVCTPITNRTIVDPPDAELGGPSLEMCRPPTPGGIDILGYSDKPTSNDD